MSNKKQKEMFERLKEKYMTLDKEQLAEMLALLNVNFVVDASREGDKKE
jgi:hypothetical protein